MTAAKTKRREKEKESSWQTDNLKAFGMAVVSGSGWVGREDWRGLEQLYLPAL